MKSTLIIAGKEIREGLRNRWVLATTVLLAALALTLTFLGSTPAGNVGANALDVVIVSLSSLTIFLLPLIALLISHDAIAGEMERGTMLLLLSYPVGRRQVLLGKFIGHLAILAFATVAGHGAAALSQAAVEAEIALESRMAFSAMIGSSSLLGAAFIAIGCLISAVFRDRSTGAGAAVGVWLLFVLIYDMALLGLLVADQGKSLTSGAVNILLMLNPADVYRLFNLTGFANVTTFSGMAGLSDSIAFGPAALLLALAAWTLFPLAFAVLAFSRREL